MRYLRFNAASLPGAMDRIFVFGHSGGGAQSSVMGASGDSPLYTPYLEHLGAAMADPDGAAISDAVAGVMAWCPITSLNHGNAAYEWNMGQFASDGTRAEGTWTAAFSKDLAAAFAAHLNDLKLTDANGTALTLTESSDGVFLAGSYYDYILAEVNTSLNNFLADTTFPHTPSNTHMVGMEPGGAPPGGGDAPTGGTPPSGGAPGEDDAKGASESSTTYNTVEEYIASLNSTGEWVAYDAATNTATVTSLRDFVVSQKSPSKDVGAFDAPDRSATENIVMGRGAEGRYFSEDSRQVLATHESTYQSLANWSAGYAISTWEADLSDTDEVGGAVTGREEMYEPLFYVASSQAGFGTSQVAPHWRIRSGLMQGDTAGTVEINLALALQQLDSTSVDFATVRGQGHTMAERTGEGTGNFIAWVRGTVS